MRNCLSQISKQAGKNLFQCWYYIYQPPRTSRICHKVKFERSLTVWIQDFPSLNDYSTSVKEPNVPFYLLIVGGRILGCILGISTMCNVNNLIQNLNLDNHYTTKASSYTHTHTHTHTQHTYIYIYIYIWGGGSTNSRPMIDVWHFRMLAFYFYTS